MTKATRKDKHGGHLVIIGGGEDRTDDKKILCRFIELCGGEKASIAVITAASAVQDEVWPVYERAFSDLGVKHCFPVMLHRREEANDPQVAERILDANGIFMTGGDQWRLLALLGGTAVDTAMHQAFLVRNACIGGTSAGASAMPGHMLAHGVATTVPEKGAVSLGAGLGFVQRVLIDQHFSERNRLGRLLAAVSQNPYLIGIGIDEDTALIVERGVQFEVLGEGAVTVVDGRQIICNFRTNGERDRLELINVKLHLFPAGSSHTVKLSEDDPRSPEFLDIVSIITSKESAS